MDRDDDVGRLIAWLKAPEFQYREFAGQRDLAEALANWPVLRKAVGAPEPPAGAAPPRPARPPARDEAPTGAAADAPAAPAARPFLTLVPDRAPPPETAPPGAAPPAPRPPAEAADAHPRSLDAIFSRLARADRPQRDARGRVAGRSGLGPIFRRLR